MKEIMVTKTAGAQEEFFFVTTTLEFWKIDRLVAGLGDGCLVVAPRTIHKGKQIYATKVRTTTKLRLSLLTYLVLQNCSKLSLKNQLNKQNPSPIFFSSKKNLTQFCRRVSRIEY
jgi:hypothetical protein